MAGNKTKTRRFSYTNPIMFQGSYYPTAEWNIQSDTGEVNPATVFADANGSYYTLDNNGSAIPVMPFHNLDEVTVTAPKKQDVSANAFSRYLTMSNDNTQVNNLPHREYNTHLKENAQKGAKEHALWEKEHPNLTAWGEVAGAIPFGVTSIPLVASTGQTLLGTAAGQAVKSGVTKVLANPLVELANNAIGLGFAGKGVYNISQGKFTPETAMDFIGLYPASRSLTGLIKPRNKPFSFKQNPIDMHIQRIKAKGEYDPSILKEYNLSEDSPNNTLLIQDIAQKNGWTYEFTKDYLLNYLNDSGHAAAIIGTGNIIKDNKLAHPNVYISHEMDHALHVPDEPLPKGTLVNPDNYFVKYNNTEVSARGSQLHDYFGHTGTEPLTVDELQYAKDNYVKDTGVDNNMTELFQSVKEWEPLAKWMTKYSTGIIPLGLINNNQSTK